MRFSLSLAALATVAGLSAAEPNGWSKTKSAPDGPTKLDDCGCWPIYQAMLRCQKLSGPNSPIEDCICIPNPDGWYTSMNGCRACLSPGSYDDNDFFDNLTRFITQLFTSCTEVGGGIQAYGNSICATNCCYSTCASLGTDGQPSWASYSVPKSGAMGNGSYVLDIAEYVEGASSSVDTAAPTTKTGAATPSDSTATETSETSSTTGVPRIPTLSRPLGNTFGTQTTLEPSDTATSATATSTGLAAPGSKAGSIRIVAAVIAVGAAVF